MSPIGTRNQRRGPSRGMPQSTVLRRVNNHMKSLNMNGEPNWYLMKSRRNLDPPPYVEDVTYVRKVRIIGSSTAGENLNITVGTFLTGLFGPSGGAPRPFTRFMVSELQAWTPASPDSFVRVTAAAATNQGTSNADKAYSDIGTQGSERPYVHIRINTKDASWLPTTTVGHEATLLFIVSVPPGRYIIDAQCHFSGTAGAPQILALAPHLASSSSGCHSFSSVTELQKHHEPQRQSQNCPMDTTPAPEPLMIPCSSFRL